MEAAISALLTRPSIEDAARVAGVAEKTLRRWMQEPEFNARYLRARRDGVYQSVARMQQATGAAGVTILKLMTDQNVPASVRLRAAEAVFVHAIKGIELEDIETRLSVLECATEETQKKR
jgi:cytosine/adenosine deaminase-related metal-dependent hydrolase